jgi:hypothetical protein
VKPAPSDVLSKINFLFPPFVSKAVELSVTQLGCLLKDWLFTRRGGGRGRVKCADAGGNPAGPVPGLGGAARGPHNAGLAWPP